MSGSLPICRVCLKTSLEYIDFDTPFEVDSSKQSEAELTYFDCFLACTRLEFDLDEKNPQCLCSSCGLELKVAYEFLRKAEHADNTLRSIATNLEDEKPDEETLKLLDRKSFDLLEEFRIDTEEQEEDQNEDEKTYICTICGDQFFSQFVLNLHVNRTHNNVSEENNSAVDKVECQICDMIISLDNLNSHMQQHEEESNSIMFEEVTNEEQLLDVGAEEVNYVMLDMSNHSSIDENVVDANDSQEEEPIEEQENPDENETPTVSTSTAKTKSVDLMNEEKNSRVTKKNCKTCTVCNKQIRKTLFQSHMNMHNGIKDFSCDYCPQSFFTKTAMQKHTHSTHASKLKSICKICHETIEGLNMKAHISENHSQIVKCTQCEHECQEAKMKDHMKRKHSESKDFLCNVCSKTFTYLSSLNSHLKSHERKRNKQESKKDEKNTCEICGKSYATREYLNSHRTIHNKIRRKFPCKECDKVYYAKTSLSNHRRLHRGNIIKCNYCPREFLQRKEYAIHLRFHTKEFPFACEMCDQKFALKGHLTVHMYGHLGYKIKCQECGKLFSNQSAYKNHSFTHTSMPYSCPFCKRGYPSRYKLKFHLKTSHSMEFSLEDLNKLYVGNQEKEVRKKLEWIKYDSNGMEVAIIQ